MIDALIGLLASFSLVSPVQAAPLSLNGVAFLKPLPSAATMRVTAAKAPRKKRPESLGVETTSKAVFVADVATGSVLYSKRPHDVMPIASLTKLMTAMVVLDQKPDLNAKLVFTEDDFRGEGKAVFAPGDTITVREAFHALLVGSVNVAGNALARTTMGREAFVDAMNRKAKELKLASPVFVDPTGVDVLNRANAADVAAMITIAMSYPEIRATASLPSVTVVTKAGKTYTIASTNLLLTSFLNKSPYRIVGAKTGSLPQSGYSMAQITQDQAGHSVVAVVFSSPNHFSRFQDMKAVTAWTFETYQWE
jgi:D-alanyl-D-alanine endopeptidase (penicillin-binding protein 7)